MADLIKALNEKEPNQARIKTKGKLEKVLSYFKIKGLEHNQDTADELNKLNELDK